MNHTIKVIIIFFFDLTSNSRMLDESVGLHKYAKQSVRIDFVCSVCKIELCS